MSDELKSDDWKRWIGQAVRIRTTGERGTVINAAGNWDDPDDRGWLVVRTADRRENYHVEDLEVAGDDSD